MHSQDFQNIIYRVIYRVIYKVIYRVIYKVMPLYFRVFTAVQFKWCYIDSVERNRHHDKILFDSD